MDAFRADQLHDCIIIINRARGESLRTGLVIVCVFRMLVLSELGPWGCPDRDWGVPCTLGPTPATPLPRYLYWLTSGRKKPFIINKSEEQVLH